jgi:DNA primase
MAGMFDNSVVLEVQQATDIVDVIGEHVSLKKKGREMVGLCPFHDDHRPSMNVNPVKQIFKCFSCGAGGDVFKFIQMRENLTFPQAVERLAERANIRLQKTEYRRQNTGGQGPEQVEEVDPNRLAKANAWAAKYFQKTLEDVEIGKLARDYVAERKISAESVKKWQIGLASSAPDGLINAAKAQKAPLKLLEQAGLVAGQGQDQDLSASRMADKFVNRLMFTITDVTGRVIGFGGRTLDENGAKYINSPTTVLFDKSNCLYGLEQARHEIVATGTAVVVEGYTDCIMAHQFGCCNVVATLGTSLTAGHGRMLRRYAKKVVLVFDSDVAGMEAANRALDVCLAQRLDIKLASVPQGKDPCDFLLAAGKEGFERVVNGAADVFQFKWDRLTEKFGKEDTLAGKRAAVEEYLDTIATGLQAGKIAQIDLGLRVNQISRIIGLDSRQINAELNRRLGRAARAAGYARGQATRGSLAVQTIDYGQGLAAAAQREMLEVLLNEPALYESVRGKILAGAFDVPILAQVAAVLFETLDAGGDASLNQILARVESVELGNCVTELAQAGHEKGNFESRLAGAMETIARSWAQKQDSRLGAVENESDFLRGKHKKAGGQNRHTVGMVE